MAQHFIKLTTPIRTAQLAGNPSVRHERETDQPLKAPELAANAIGKETASRLVDVLSQIVADMNRLAETRQQAIQQVRSVAVELAVTIAEQIVWRQLEEERHDIEGLVAAAIAHCEEAPRLKIQLHPADYALLQREVEEVTRQQWKDANVEIVPDGSIARGDCLADMEQVAACFDWRLQLSEMKQRLLNGTSHVLS